MRGGALWLAVAVGCVQRTEPPGAGGNEEKLAEGDRLELVWHAVPTTTHPGCDYGVTAYDAARGEVVYFTTPQPWLTGVSASTCNETWVYDGVDWREANPVGPSPRSQPSMAYDPVRQRVVLFGGGTRNSTDTVQTLRNEVWEWDGVSWVNRTPPATAPQPQPMRMAGLEFDPVSGRMLLFAGIAATSHPRETWSWDGTSWTLLATDGPQTMPDAAYDGDGHLIGYGSMDVSPPGQPYVPGTRQVFAWDGDSWSSEDPNGYSNWAVYDPTANATLFSGFFNSDVQYFGPNGFVPVASTGDLPGTAGRTSLPAYDSARDRTVLWYSDFGNVVMELDAWTVANGPPAFVNPPTSWSFDAGYRAVKSVGVSEPDGDALELTVTGLPTGFGMNEYPGTYVASWTPELDEVGSYEASFVLSDGFAEETLTVPVTVALRDLPGFPHGVWERQGTGTGTVDVEVCGYDEGSADVQVTCALHLENPGFADLSCSAAVPYWTPSQGCGSMGAMGLDLDAAWVFGTVRMGDGEFTSFRIEEGGYSDVLHDWIYPAVVLEGAIYPVADGYDVSVSPSLDDWTRDTETNPVSAALLHLVMPNTDPVASLGDLRPGDLVVTEILRDPSVVGDVDGEWFEVENASGAAVNLRGLEISDEDFDQHVVNGDLVVDAGERVVFGRRTDPAFNGGAPVQWATGADVVLANGADELVLGFGGVVFDQVSWGSGWPAVAGAAMALVPGGSATDNDAAGAWCAATTPFGSGDLGSPGAPNPGC
jgi:hypothetical protein